MTPQPSSTSEEYDGPRGWQQQMRDGDFGLKKKVIDDTPGEDVAFKPKGSNAGAWRELIKDPDFGKNFAEMYKQRQIEKGIEIAYKPPEAKTGAWQDLIKDPNFGKNTIPERPTTPAKLIAYEPPKGTVGMWKNLINDPSFGKKVEAAKPSTPPKVIAF